MARGANADIFGWLIEAALENNVDLPQQIRRRREELAKRHFYIAD
jgi:hypothetical protein